jgi:hypothetical protein
VAVLNPRDSQVTEITVDTDYGTDKSDDTSAPAINYLQNVELNTITTIRVTKTASGVNYPRELRLALRGCGTPAGMWSKAQIEDGK